MSLEKLEHRFKILMSEYETHQDVGITVDRVWDNLYEFKGKTYGEIHYLINFKNKSDNLRIEMFDFTNKGKNQDEEFNRVGYDIVLNKIKTEGKSGWEYQEYKYAKNVTELIQAIKEFRKQL